MNQCVGSVQLNELDRQKNSLELQLAVLSTEMQAYEPRKESLVEERSKARAEAHDAETKQENKVAMALSNSLWCSRAVHKYVRAHGGEDKRNGSRLDSFGPIMDPGFLNG